MEQITKDLQKINTAFILDALVKILYLGPRIK